MFSKSKVCRPAAITDERAVVVLSYEKKNPIRELPSPRAIPTRALNARRCFPFLGQSLGCGLRLLADFALVPSDMTGRRNSRPQ
jgi:hypothetical protein